MAFKYFRKQAFSSKNNPPKFLEPLCKRFEESKILEAIIPRRVETSK